MLTSMLRREGFRNNHKLVERNEREDCLHSSLGGATPEEMCQCRMEFVQ